MNEMNLLIIAFFVGLSLGLFFFAGLWWTVKKIIAGHVSPLLVLSSLFIRFGIVIIGFYFMGTLGENSSWHRWLACLCGFFVSRLFVKHRVNTEFEEDHVS